MDFYSLATVLLQQPEGVSVAEVLELNQAVLPIPAHDGLHELFDELVVLRAANAPLAQTDVERVVQHGLVVCADVCGDRSKGKAMVYGRAPVIVI